MIGTWARIYCGTRAAFRMSRSQKLARHMFLDVFLVMYLCLRFFISRALDSKPASNKYEINVMCKILKKKAKQHK